MVKVEIKRDGKKAAIDFASIAELNISEALHRHGVTMQHVAEQLGITRAAVQQMITGSPNVSTIYKISWVLGCDPRDLFFRMSEDGKIIEEPKVSFEKLKEYAEQERMGPIFSQKPQDAKRVLVCPSCGTTFLVTNIPHYQDEK